jgi:hypothetical protein
MPDIVILGTLNTGLPTIVLYDRQNYDRSHSYELVFGSKSGGTQSDPSCDLSFRAKGGEFREVLDGLPFMTFHGIAAHGGSEELTFLVKARGKECILRVRIYGTSGDATVTLHETVSGWFNGRVLGAEIYREDTLPFFSK